MTYYREREEFRKHVQRRTAQMTHTYQCPRCHYTVRTCGQAIITCPHEPGCDFKPETMTLVSTTQEKNNAR